MMDGKGHNSGPQIKRRGFPKHQTEPKTTQKERRKIWITKIGLSASKQLLGLPIRNLTTLMKSTSSMIHQELRHQSWDHRMSGFKKNNGSRPMMIQAMGMDPGTNGVVRPRTTGTGQRTKTSPTTQTSMTSITTWSQCAQRL